MKSRRFLGSRSGQAVLLVVGLLTTVNFAVGVYHRWDGGGIRLVVSIVGVVVMGFCTYSAGYFLVTGRSLADRLLKSAR